MKLAIVAGPSTPGKTSVLGFEDAEHPIELRGNPPVGTCTICVGRKDIGWQNHFGVVRPLESQTFYRGE